MKMKKVEIMAVFAVLAVAFVAVIALYIFPHRGNMAVIYLSGKEYMTLPLDKNAKVTVEGRNTVCIENNEVYVEWADCPDKLCIKQGKLLGEGKSIVCLPNKMTVKIEER